MALVIPPSLPSSSSLSSSPYRKPVAVEELVARFDRERYRFENDNGDVTINEGWLMDGPNGPGPVTLKGMTLKDELMPRQVYRFLGRWIDYRNKRSGQNEKQFEFTSFVLQTPATEDAIVAYLSKAGEGHGLGKVRCRAMWRAFGAEAVRTLRENPERVIEALATQKLKWELDQAVAVAAILEQERTVEGCTLDLTSLLAGRGFPKTTTRHAIDKWGENASRIIRRNPYALMALRGCGFRRCDSMYLSLGHPPERLKRQALCAWHAISRDTEGHTWFDIGVAKNGIQENVAGAKLQVEKALSLALRAKILTEIRTDGVHGSITASADASQGKGFRWVAETARARHESEIARIVVRSFGQASEWPGAEAIKSIEGLSDHQKEILSVALRGPIAILGGGPGCGKTYSIAQLIKHFAGSSGSGLKGVKIGAPTGKAAVRVSESLQAQGIDMKARTWHSMLMQVENGKKANERFFQAKILIGDESSMLDTDLFARILRAIPVGTMFLLVGDVNQLPPVGHGAPLRDLIAAGLPYGELTEIKRNSGGIVETCAAIRTGSRWQFEPESNLEHVDVFGVESQIAAIFARLRRARSEGYDPVWDCQVVVPVNAKSGLSRKALNKILQSELNRSPGDERSPFRVGDKLVNTKNSFYKAIRAGSGRAGEDEEVTKNEREEVYVANGELAKVISVDGNSVVAELQSPYRLIQFHRGAEKAGSRQEQEENEGEESSQEEGVSTGCNFELGYALSVHKSQGSEWPIVIGVVDEYPGAKRICSREYWYTLISRAKEKCCLIGKKQTIDAGCRRVAIGLRKTFLKELVLAGKSEKILAESGF